MHLQKLLREIEIMNENLQSQIANLLKLKIISFKKDFSHRYSKIEIESKENPKDKFLAGKLSAYAEILKLSEDKLKDLQK